MRGTSGGGLGWLRRGLWMIAVCFSGLRSSPLVTKRLFVRRRWSLHGKVGQLQRHRQEILIASAAALLRRQLLLPRLQCLKY